MTRQRHSMENTRKKGTGQRTGLYAQLRHLFRPRQILLRSQGTVQYLYLSTRLQLAAAAVFVLAAGGIGWTASTIVFKDRILAERDDRIARLLTTRRSLEQALKTRSEYAAGLERTLTQKYGELRLLLDQRKALEENLNALKGAYEQIAAERNDLSTKLLKAKQDNEGLNRRLNSLQAQLGEAGSRIGDLQARLETALQQRDRQRRAYLDTDARLAATRARLSRAERMAATLRQGATAALESRREIQRKYRQAQAEIAMLKASLTALEERSGAQQAQLEERARQIAALRSRTAAAIAERDKALALENELRSRAVAMKTRLFALKQAQTALLERLKYATERSLSSLDGTLKMAGIDTGKAVASILGRNQRPGIGGPYIARGARPATEEKDTLAIAPEDEPFINEYDRNISVIETKVARLQAMRSLLERLPLSRPVDVGYISSAFGKRRDPMSGKRAVHKGVDISAPARTSVYATAPGRVTFAGWKGAFGKLVEIDHGNGIITRYAHLSKILVRKGQDVAFRQKIGRVGSTGRSTGPHVHYEIEYEGQVRNPMNFFKAGRDVFKNSQIVKTAG